MDQTMEVLPPVRQDILHRPAHAQQQGLSHPHKQAKMSHQYPHAATYRTRLVKYVPQEDQGLRLCLVSALPCARIRLTLSATLPQVCQPAPSAQIQSRNSSHIGLMAT